MKAALFIALLGSVASAQELTPPPLVADELRTPLHVAGEAVPEVSLKPLVSPARVQRKKLRTVEGAERFQYSGVVPDGFHLVVEPRMGLVGGGLAAFAAGYLPVALGGVALGAPMGAVPIAGPILLTAQWWSDRGWFSDIANGMLVVACLVDLAAQVAGVVMFTVGMGSPRRWLERDVSQPSITFVPTSGGLPGASVVGRF